MHARPCAPALQAQAQQQQQQQQQGSGGRELPLVGPAPQRFAVAEGQTKEVASAAFPALMRLGSGAFCMGYKTALVPDDGAASTFVRGRAAAMRCGPGSEPQRGGCSRSAATHPLSTPPPSRRRRAGKYAVLGLLGRLLRETSDVGGYPRPAQPIVLYEFEGCPFCRKVREAVALLDLDAKFLPCPQVSAPTALRWAALQCFCHVAAGWRQFYQLLLY